MKIFITGITGFVGSSLANRFLQQGHEVSGTGRKEILPAHIDKRCIYLRQDITKPVNEINADIVIHAAAQVDDAAGYENHYSNNVTGTLNVINACKNVQLFILISTSSVYNFHGTNPCTEDEAGNDFDKLSNYGKTKFLAEKELQNAQHISSKIILRPRAIYGTGDTVLLPRLLQLVKNKKIILPAHITRQISLTQINNLADAVELCFKFPPGQFSVFNITDDRIYSLRTAIPELIKAVCDGPFTIFFVPKILWNLILKLNSLFNFIPRLTIFGSKQLTQIALLDINRAKKELGYSPKYSFYDSLKDIGIWYKANNNAIKDY